MRLIDADALKCLMEKRKKFFVDAYGGSFHCMSKQDKGRCYEIDACIASIVNAPTASTKATQYWIPINEGLPSDSYEVFVTVIDDHGDTPYRYTNVAWLCNGTWIANNEILFGDVIAWMPRPKPYKGGDKK